jgi:hypothetical protein
VSVTYPTFPILHLIMRMFGEEYKL